MKFFTGLLALAACANAHTIFQRLKVDGYVHEKNWGIRGVPANSDPIVDVGDWDFACNKIVGALDKPVIEVPAGASLGAWWGHNLYSAEGDQDPENPIAESHHGPILVYLARVNDAAKDDTHNLDWFKIAHSGFDTGAKQWAVDKLRADKGWYNFQMPSCVAPGQYLMRVEVIALHEGDHPGKAQFYMECAQIRVTGGGTSHGTEFASFPGTYSAEDPGIHFDIYDSKDYSTRKPRTDFAGGEYKIPGPGPLQCNGNDGA